VFASPCTLVAGDKKEGNPSVPFHISIHPKNICFVEWEGYKAEACIKGNLHTALGLTAIS